MVIRTAGLLCLALVTSGGAAAQESPAASSGRAFVHHPVTTMSSQAQAAFDRGLLDYYAYDPESAQHEFYTAADLDRHLAMAYWGIALSNAANLNVASTDDREQQAAGAIEQAQSLQKYASTEERSLIAAAVKRFSADPKSDRAALLRKYRDAMARVASTYASDPDAAALYGEAALYVATGGHANSKDTLSDRERRAYVRQVSALLPYFEKQTSRFPNHVGLLHFFIHTADESNEQRLVIAASRRLAAFELPPQDSHLTHMPGHIYFKVGLYDAALDTSRRSVAMDDEYMRCCHPGYYGATRYYHEHNVEFLLYALTETGRTEEAVATARHTGIQPFVARQLIAAKRWRDVLAVPYARGRSDTIAFARGLAFARLGDSGSATRSLTELPEAPADSASWESTVAAMGLTLRATIADRRGDSSKAVVLLQRAETLTDRGDRMVFAEFPAMYYYSPHLALAELAARLGKRDLARRALQSELAMNPQSPIALRDIAQLGSVR